MNNYETNFDDNDDHHIDTTTNNSRINCHKSPHDCNYTFDKITGFRKLSVNSGCKSEHLVKKNYDMTLKCGYGNSHIICEQLRHMSLKNTVHYDGLRKTL